MRSYLRHIELTWSLPSLYREPVEYLAIGSNQELVILLTIRLRPSKIVGNNQVLVVSGLLISRFDCIVKVRYLS